MAVEAQRLIAISLGKMASSRSQRGGARLHKSLLVASVLHSAQTVALLNDQQNPDVTIPSLSNSSSTLADSSLPNPVSDVTESREEVENSCVHSLFHDRKYSELRPRVDNESEEEVELLTLTSCVNSTQTKDIATTFTPEIEELRLPASRSFNVLVNSTVKCAHFLDSKVHSPKRKRIESDDDDEPLAKHLRFAQNSDYPSCGVEPMQTESWQVTSLVYSFSMGFSGLLRSSDGSEFSSSESTEQDQPIYMHSSTSESIISCSTQIREALDTLTRPAIAMTV